MGCSSSTPKKSTPQNAQEPAQTRSPPTLTEETAEERALTQLKLVFDSIDADQSGTVSKDELTGALNEDQSLGALIKEAGFNLKYNVLSDLDSNKDGCLSWEEFQGHLKERAIIDVKATGGELAAAELPATKRALNQLKAVFDSIDADADGAVSSTELTAKLNKDTDEHGLMKKDTFGQLVADAGFNPNWCTFDQLDTNRDGRITWEEFENNLKLVEAAKKEVKETGDLSAAVVVQEPEVDDGAAPICGCFFLS